MRYFLICSFLFATCFVSAQSTSLKVADSLWKNKNYFEASVWYERCIYEAESDAIINAAIAGKLKCLKASNLYDQALEFMVASNALNNDESFKTELIYQQILCSYLSAKFENAIALSTQFEERFTDPKMISKINLLKLLSYNELNRWKEADSIYAQINLQTNPSEKVKQLYNNIPHLKSEKKAKALSTFLPGSGLFYAGKPWEGVLNILLEIGSVTFAVKAFLSEYYLSSWLIGGGLATSFYYGGERRAETLVKKYNLRKSIQYNEQLKAALVKVFSSN